MNRNIMKLHTSSCVELYVPQMHAVWFSYTDLATVSTSLCDFALASELPGHSCTRGGHLWMLICNYRNGPKDGPPTVRARRYGSGLCAAWVTLSKNLATDARNTEADAGAPTFVAGTGLVSTSKTRCTPALDGQFSLPDLNETGHHSRSRQVICQMSAHLLA